MCVDVPDVFACSAVPQFSLVVASSVLLVHFLFTNHVGSVEQRVLNALYLENVGRTAAALAELVCYFLVLNSPGSQWDQVDILAQHWLPVSRKSNAYLSNNLDLTLALHEGNLSNNSVCACR